MLGGIAAVITTLMHRFPFSLRAFAGLLALLAGFVDAVGFLSWGGFFVSFMSGNSTRLGVGGVEEWSLAMRAAALILSFVAGVTLGTWAGARARRRQATVLLLVAALLTVAGLAALLKHPAIANGAAAAAMGAVNAVFGKNAEYPVGLTYVSGTLVRTGQLLADAIGGGPRWAWLPYVAHWLALVVGAGIGAACYARLELSALWLAAMFSLLLAMVAGARSNSEEGPERSS